MLKWLLLFAIAYVAYRWWMRPLPSNSSGPTSRRPEPMLQCAKCGIHIPQSEAVLGKDHSFCCEQHRDSWTQDR